MAALSVSGQSSTGRLRRGFGFSGDVGEAKWKEQRVIQYVLLSDKTHCFDLRVHCSEQHG